MNCQGAFDYLKHFTGGNKAFLFRKEEARLPAAYTVKSYYTRWIKKQSDRVRPHQVKTYTSHFERHILPAKVDGGAFGKLHLLSLTADHLRSLQDRLKAKGLKSASVNAVVHSSLRAMLRDARGEGAMTTDLYDRAIFKPLPLTEMNPSIDPYTPEEREAILEGFRSKRPQFYPFCFLPLLAGFAAERVNNVKAQER